MAGSKDHTDVSTTNIIKPSMEALLTNNQQPFDDLIRREEDEVLRQLVEQHDKEEEEVLRQYKERHKKATKRYLSYSTVDRHQMIIRQWEIDMTSLLPPS
jgi:cytidylate kinase